MTTDITPIDVARQRSKLATTPKESFANEADWKAAEAWAKEQRNYEMVVEAFRGWIFQRRNTTELIKPTIKHGGYRHGKQSQVDNSVHLTADYGFTPKQWHRRNKELEVEVDEIDEYIGICIEMMAQPTLYGMLKMLLQIIADSTGDEWWTPIQYIKSVRKVMGTIDLDPASCARANAVIKASTFYTEEDNGLEQPWHGKVFMNPPYSMNKPFAEKMIEEHASGNVNQAIVLLGAHAIETKWFSKYWNYVLCFTGHRIRFNTPDGPAIAGNIAGSVFIYLGSNQKGFAKEFEQHGYVVKRWSQ